MDLVQLAGGLMHIIKGGDYFVAASVRIAEFLKMPRVVIGSTLVSLATTTPELVVSIMSGLKGESGLAMGNAVGSCICNMALILGITALLKRVDIHPRALRAPLIVMCGCGLLLFLLTFDLVLTRWQGGLLIVLGVSYFCWDFWTHYRDRKPADIAEATVIEAESAATRWGWFKKPAGTAVQFILGAGIVVIGSRFLVDGAVGVAGRLGIPPIVIGLTVVSAGTSLPELITAITSARKAVADLAVGNVLGANIANLTLIVGAAAVLHDVSMVRLTQLFNLPALLLIMALLIWSLLTRHRLSGREGCILLGSYAVYIAALVFLTIYGWQ